MVSNHDLYQQSIVPIDMSLGLQPLGIGYTTRACPLRILDVLLSAVIHLGVKFHCYCTTTGLLLVVM